MKNLNLELSLINSPYYDKLLKEIKLILEQKRKLLFNVRSKADFESKLSYSEKGIYESIIKRENELLSEMVYLKGWSISEDTSVLNNLNKGEDYDIYDTNNSYIFS